MKTKEEIQEMIKKLDYESRQYKKQSSDIQSHWHRMYLYTIGKIDALTDILQ